MGAAAATVAWLALIGVLLVATRAKTPEATPAGLEVGGDEPPAVVNLITRGWKVHGEAMTATLVDLAARHVLSFTDHGDGEFSVSVAQDHSALTGYERQVLDLVRDLADDGTVPAAALTCGTDSEAASFRKRFTKAVVADARRRSLSRPRWSKTVLALVSAAAVAPALLAAGAMVALPDAHSSSSNSHDNPVGAFVGVAIFVWGALVALFHGLRAERETAAGLECAGRWLGLQHNLEADGTFPELPPTAVAVWDRYLAYAVALGVAATTERTFPLGAESDTEAWSAIGGRWRVVRIRYPQRLPPGWGRPPWQVAFIGLFSLAVASGIGLVALPTLYDAQADLVRDATAQDRNVALGVSLGLAVVALVLVLLALRGLWMVIIGAADIRRGQTIDGVVLRVRSRNKHSYVAVDDGTSDHVRAWVNASTSPAVQGQHVRVAVAIHVGYVRTLASGSKLGEGGPQVGR